MFKIGVVVSTWHYFADPFKLQPLHELYFATVLSDAFEDIDIDIDIEVIDLRDIRWNKQEFNPETLSEYVPKKDLYVYWVMKAADYPEVLATVDCLRSLYPDSKHISGGTHIEHYFEDAQKYFDSSVFGPGEPPFIDIVTRLLHGDQLQLYYKDHWRISTYDDYPIARRDFLPRRSIVNRSLFQKYGKVMGSSALLQRGCNFNCTYCVYNIPNIIQRRMPETIEKEIDYLKREYQIEGLNLRDEVAIPIKNEVSIPFLEAIGSGDIIWRGQTRVGVERDIIKLAAETGCVELAIGVETASPLVLDLIKKGQTFPMVRDFISHCHEFDIRVKMCLILGLPGEPQDVVDVTKDYITKTHPDYVAVSGFCPVPGSIIYKKSAEYGIKYINDDMSKHAHLMFRFDDDDDHGLPFEYEDENKWGKTFTRNQIIDNIKELQDFCRERDMVY